MERHCYLIETDEKNTQRLLYEDEGIKEFLTSLGARVYDMAMDAVNDLFFRFSKGEIDGHTSGASQPVSKIYCTMNLSRLSIQPFAVYGTDISRVSGCSGVNYSQIFISPQEALYGIEFFGQVFGTRCLTEEEFLKCIAGNGFTDFSKLESKTVLPVISDKDRAFVCGIVEQIYNKKNVVIRLAGGADFDKRATELLVQIYALLPPVRRIQTGFVINKNAEDILRIADGSAACLFVTPRDENVDELIKQGFSVYETGALFFHEFGGSDFYDLLYKWSLVDYREREETAKVFERQLLLDGYSDSELYSMLIKSYYDPRQWWWESEQAKGTISDLQELVDKHKDTSLLKISPAINSRFREKSESLLAEGRSLNHMLLECMEHPDAANTQVLDYCINNIGFSKIALSTVMGYKMRRDEREQISQKEMEKAYKAELDEQRAAYDKRIEEMKAKHSAEIEAIVKRSAEDGRADRDEECDNLRKQIDQLIVRHKSEIEELKAEHEALIKQLTDKHLNEIREIEAKNSAFVSELAGRHSDEIARLKAERAEETEKLTASQSVKAILSGAMQQADQESVLDETLRSARMSFSVDEPKRKQPLLKFKPDHQVPRRQGFGLISLRNIRSKLFGGGNARKEKIRAVPGFNSGGFEVTDISQKSLLSELERVRGNKLFYEKRAEKLESDIVVLNEKIQKLSKRNRSPKTGPKLFAGVLGGILISLAIGAALILSGIVRLDFGRPSTGLIMPAALYFDERSEPGRTWIYTP